MTREQQYKADQKLEAMAAKFLDHNFYSVFGEKARRYSDLEHQYAGIDVTVCKTRFDEKLKVHGCLNQVLGCPSFEIQLVDRAGNIRDGWFANMDLSTDYYAYIGVSATTNVEAQLTSESQISAADVLWVKKQDVLDFVQEQSSIEELKADANSLRDSAQYSYGAPKLRKTYSHRKFWLTYSTYLKEQPVNLVTTRQNLEALPHTKHFIVYKGKVVKA